MSTRAESLASGGEREPIRDAVGVSPLTSEEAGTFAELEASFYDPSDVSSESPFDTDPYDLLEAYDPLSRKVESKDIEGTKLHALNGGELSIAPGGDMLSEPDGVLAMVTIGAPGKGNTVVVYDLNRFSSREDSGVKGMDRFTNPTTGLTFTAPRGTRYLVGSTDDRGGVMSLKTGESTPFGRAPEDAPRGDRRSRFDSVLTEDIGPEDVIFTIDKDSGVLTIKDGSESGHVVVETVAGSAEKLIGDLSGAVGTVAVESVVERPLSGRVVTKPESLVKPEFDTEADKKLYESLSSGLIARTAAKIEGVRDARRGMSELRDGRKDIIGKQRESLKDVVFDARGDKWNARGARVRTLLDNNAYKRVGMRIKEREDIRKDEFAKIDTMKNSKGQEISNFRKRALKLQARKDAWAKARKNVEKTTSDAFAAAKGDVVSAKNELKRRKQQLKSTGLRPWRRRTTINGESAGFRESWKDAKSSITEHGMSDVQKKRLANERIKALNNRRGISGADARKRYINRPVSDRKSQHAIGPRRADGSF